MVIQKDLIDRTEIEIDKVPQEELDEREDGVPAFKEKIEFTEPQIEKLKDQIFKAYERLKVDRKDVDDLIMGLKSQYSGEMVDDAGLEFNLNVPITQVKVDSGARLTLKAFMESDPKFTVTPRPTTAKQDKWDVTVNAQTDYLDYKFDEEIDIESPMRKVLHQAWLYPVGLIKVPYEYTKKNFKREQFFSGEPDTDEQGNIFIPGLKEFLVQYPDAVNPGDVGHWAFKDLVEGKDVTFKANYYEPTYDDPKPSFVDIKDFWVDKDTEGYEGLCDAQLTIERQKYSWWELLKMEKNEDFENVRNVKVVTNDNDGESVDEDDGEEQPTPEPEANYKTKKYRVLECVYHFNEKIPDDDDDYDVEDEIKIICWFEVQSKAFLGAILYPYDTVECIYVPFYVENKEAGFYKGHFAEKLTDSHLAQNAILNFMLTESWQQLMTTPIIKQGSPLADQFYNKRWKPGVPLEIPKGALSLESELGFLDRAQKGVAVQLMQVLQFLKQMDDDRTGINEGISGKTDPLDPSAPASKTAMLLQQSGINVSDYINSLLPSFNKVAEIILQLTYQMSKEGRPFKQRQTAGMVTGQDPFGTLTRDQMSAKTNIQSRAAGFAFDKVNEKRENLTLFQLFRQDPIISQNPEGVYAMARTLIQSWSPLWKNKVDTILPDPQTFNQQQFEIAVQALAVYLKDKTDKAKLLGGEPQADFKEYMNLATSMMAEAITSTEEEGQSR